MTKIEQAARQALEALSDCVDDSRTVLSQNEQIYTERYRPHVLIEQERIVKDAETAIAALHEALSEVQALSAAPQQKARHLTQALTDPENQPNQYGVEFGMSGQQMHFKIGNQLFRLAYEPDDQQEFEFMKRMLIHAFSTFTPDVKAAPGERRNTKTHDLLSTVVGVLMGYREGAARQPYKPDSVIDKVVNEAVEHLKDWPYPEAAPQPSPTAPATQQPEGDVVAYLDVGANGYLDLGSELSEDALQQLPKGRHALVIAGTYGIDGYVAAPQPSPTAQSADSVQEDAARYRWLREGNDAKHGAAWHVAVNLYGCEWDSAIDAALAAQGGNK